jgi:hypothetical protein
VLGTGDRTTAPPEASKSSKNLKGKIVEDMRWNQYNYEKDVITKDAYKYV